MMLPEFIYPELELAIMDAISGKSVLYVTPTQESAVYMRDQAREARSNILHDYKLQIIANSEGLQQWLRHENETFILHGWNSSARPVVYYDPNTDPDKWES